jgi:hypothetical protein
VLKHAFNVAAEEWRELAPISRLDISQVGLQTLSDPLAAQMDPMKREQTLDPTDDARALLDQVLTFAFDTFSILFLNGRNPHVTRHFSIARKPCPQCACHSFSIEAIRLCSSPLARHEKARGIEHDRANAPCDQQPRKPKTIITNLVAHDDLQWTRRLALRLQSCAFQEA